MKLIHRIQVVMFLPIKNYSERINPNKPHLSYHISLVQDAQNWTLASRVSHSWRISNAMILHSLEFLTWQLFHKFQKVLKWALIIYAFLAEIWLWVKASVVLNLVLEIWVEFGPKCYMWSLCLHTDCSSSILGKPFMMHLNAFFRNMPYSSTRNYPG